MIYKKYDRISRLVTAILLMLVNLVIVNKLSRLACNLKFGVYTFQPNFELCSLGLLGSKLLPEVISAILSRYMTVTTPTN